MIHGITRRKFLKSIGAGTLLSLFSNPFSIKTIPNVQAQEHMNVVLLMSDEHQATAMGCADSSYITPNLDRLAETGVRFTNCFATCPLCSPSRSSILTGKTPTETGVTSNNMRLDPKLKTVAEFFSAQGYRTAYFGKWHLRSNPLDHGFQKAWTYDPHMRERRTMTQNAVRYVDEKLNHQRPFFMMVSWIWPHGPMKLVEKYADEFPKDSIPIPANFHDDLLDKPRWYLKIARNFNLNRWRLRKRSRIYRTMVRGMDHWVGQILDALERGGHLENTIIAFTADHGAMLGSHKMFRKRVAFDESSRVPLILNIPNTFPTRTVVDDLVSNSSIPGTLIEAAGFDPPQSFSGGSVLQSIFNENHPENEVVFYEYKRYKAIRTRTRKYVKHHEYIDELYDLENDPLEMHNLVDDEAYSADKQALNYRLARFWTNK